MRACRHTSRRRRGPVRTAHGERAPRPGHGDPETAAAHLTDGRALWHGPAPADVGNRSSMSSAHRAVHAAPVRHGHVTAPTTSIDGYPWSTEAGCCRNIRTAVIAVIAPLAGPTCHIYARDVSDGQAEQARIAQQELTAAANCSTNQLRDTGQCH
ncbi:BTAD domain-containing putative transcriptional regulator [Virgisporangium ochraceum]|uniref:BTAD domain-containing putative transcriptional regulator n=1 Tax=Virgisporangium ochraceum TaxID=65505 RepID=UPI0019427100